MTDLLVLAAVLGAAGLAAAVWRRGQGRVRVVAGGDAGRPAKLLLFTSPTCAHCPAARMVVTEVAAERDDLVLDEVDVAVDLERARRHHVSRTPTTLLLDAHGHVRARVTGVPERAALDEAIEAA